MSLERKPNEAIRRELGRKAFLVSLRWLLTRQIEQLRLRQRRSWRRKYERSSRAALDNISA